MNPLSPDEILQLSRFALDHADDAAFWSDSEGRLLYANDAAGRALNYPPEDLLGMTLFQLSPELTSELWSQLWKEIKTQNTFDFEFTLKAKDNHTFPVEMTVHAMPTAKQDVLCVFFRDANEKKRLQQLKTEFVSTVSHELRTPMTIIRESVSQVLDGLLGEVPPAQREALYLTLSGIDRLARIINNLLDVSKMEAGKSALRWERLDLVELIREVVETFASRARERGLDLRADLPANPAIIYADYDRLVQVFTNLVGNALKFTEKGKIEVSVRDQAQEIECAISDNGIGIPKEDLGRVFNKFEQLSQPAVTGEKGTGLGLAICKGIVELHQGRIWAESQRGRGSIFYFTLPKRTAQDLFLQKMSSELTLASTTGGNVTAVRFEVKITKKSGSPHTGFFLNGALDELLETIKTHGARKTDFILKDSQAVWLILLNMTKKEATRIVQQILTAYTASLEKHDMAGGIQATSAQCSYPEESKNVQDLMKKLQPGRGKHVS